MAAPPGLYVIPNWITEETEQEIVDFLCRGEWSYHVSANRPTQHFGYKYTISGYSSSTEKVASDWGPLEKIARRLEIQHDGVKIAQCLANLYFRDSQIGAHVDKESPLVIFGVSLTADINMDWISLDNPKDKRRIVIPRWSLYMMTGDSATKWKHCVPQLKRIYYPNTDKYVTKPDQYIRVSLTFRHFDHAIIPGQESLRSN